MFTNAHSGEGSIVDLEVDEFDGSARLSPRRRQAHPVTFINFEGDTEMAWPDPEIIRG
jgi:hypothetical protein